MKKVVVAVILIGVGIFAYLTLQPTRKGISATSVANSFGHDGWWVSIEHGNKEGVAVNRLFKEFSQHPYRGGHAWIVVSDQQSGEQIGKAMQALTSSHPAVGAVARLVDQAVFREHDATVLDQQVGDARIGFASWSCPVSRVKIAVLAILPTSSDFRTELTEMNGGCHTYSAGYKDLGNLPNPPRVFVYTPLLSHHRVMREHRRPSGFEDWWTMKKLEGLWLEWRDEDAAQGSKHQRNDARPNKIAEESVPEQVHHRAQPAAKTQRLILSQAFSRTDLGGRFYTDDVIHIEDLAAPYYDGRVEIQEHYGGDHIRHLTAQVWFQKRGQGEDRNYEFMRIPVYHKREAEAELRRSGKRYSWQRADYRVEVDIHQVEYRDAGSIAREQRGIEWGYYGVSGEIRIFKWE